MPCAVLSVRLSSVLTIVRQNFSDERALHQLIPTHKACRDETLRGPSDFVTGDRVQKWSEGAGRPPKHPNNIPQPWLGVGTYLTNRTGLTLSVKTTSL